MIMAYAASGRARCCRFVHAETARAKPMYNKGFGRTKSERFSAHPQIGASALAAFTACVKFWSESLPWSFTSYPDILDHCCDAWNKLTDQPWLIMSIGLRDWAHRF